MLVVSINQSQTSVLGRFSSLLSYRYEIFEEFFSPYSANCKSRLSPLLVDQESTMIGQIFWKVGKTSLATTNKIRKSLKKNLRDNMKKSEWSESNKSYSALKKCKKSFPFISPESHFKRFGDSPTRTIVFKWRKPGTMVKPFRGSRPTNIIVYFNIPILYFMLNVFRLAMSVLYPAIWVNLHCRWCPTLSIDSGDHHVKPTESDEHNTTEKGCELKHSRHPLPRLRSVFMTQQRERDNRWPETGQIPIKPKNPFNDPQEFGWKEKHGLIRDNWNSFRTRVTWFKLQQVLN